VIPSYAFGSLWVVNADNDSDLEVAYVAEAEQYHSGVGVWDFAGVTGTQGADIRRWNCSFVQPEYPGKAPDALTQTGRPVDLDGDGKLELAVAFKGVSLGIDPNYGPCPDADQITTETSQWTMYIFELDTGKVELKVPNALPSGVVEVTNGGQPELLVDEEGTGQVVYTWDATGQLTKVPVENAFGSVLRLTGNGRLPDMWSHGSIPKWYPNADTNGDQVPDAVLTQTGDNLLHWVRIQNGVATTAASATQGCGTIRQFATLADGSFRILTGDYAKMCVRQCLEPH